MRKENGRGRRRSREKKKGEMEANQLGRGKREEKRKDILIKKHKWERVGRGVGRRYRIGRESRVERRARERNRARIEIAEKERAKKVHSKRKNKNGRGCWETRMRR